MDASGAAVSERDRQQERGPVLGGSHERTPPDSASDVLARVVVEELVRAEHLRLQRVLASRRSLAARTGFPRTGANLTAFIGGPTMTVDAPAPGADPPVKTGVDPVSSSQRRVVVGGRDALILARGLGVMLVALVAFGLYGSAALEGLQQRSLLSGFARMSSADRARDPERRASRGHTTALLDIPRIGIYSIVQDGLSRRVLRQGPGRAPGSAPPGHAGLAVVAAHRVTYGGPFRHIGDLRPGDTVNFSTPTQSYRYSVDSDPLSQFPETSRPDGKAHLFLVSGAPAYRDSSGVVVVSASAPAQELSAAGPPPSWTGRTTGSRAAAAGSVAAGVFLLGAWWVRSRGRLRLPRWARIASATAWLCGLAVFADLVLASRPRLL